MTRFLTIATTLLSATAASAAAPASHYRAEPAVRPAAERIVLRGAVWRCDGTQCVASRVNSRPEIVCAAFARQVGAVRSFAAGDRLLTPEELEKCNARAR